MVAIFVYINMYNLTIIIIKCLTLIFILMSVTDAQPIFAVFFYQNLIQIICTFLNFYISHITTSTQSKIITALKKS